MSWRPTVTVVFLLLSAALASCGGGEKAPAGSTATPALTPVPTATPEALACPPLAEPEDLPQVRAFAAEIEGALSSQDAEFFLDRAVEQEIACTGQEESGPCVGKEAGTVLKGIRVVPWLGSEVTLGTLDEFRQFLSGQWSMYALAYLEPGRFIAMTTASAQSAGAAKPSDAWLMTFVWADDSWRVTQLTYVQQENIDDWLSAEALSTAWERCTYWERWGLSESPAGE
ncbi:MAG: hypothetical protein Q8P22_06730 [Chloroflexota bacterium]|nr:hypothetical protein [Chloroflexota bacterium]